MQRTTFLRRRRCLRPQPAAMVPLLARRNPLSVMQGEIGIGGRVDRRSQRQRVCNRWLAARHGLQKQTAPFG